MVSGKHGITVIPGSFKPRLSPATIARRNRAAFEVPVRAGLSRQYGSPEGHVFRATVILGSLSRRQRIGIDRRLAEMIGNGQTMEDIAWEFVTAETDQDRTSASLDDAARAKAFMIIAFGTETQH